MQGSKVGGGKLFNKAVLSSRWVLLSGSLAVLMLTASISPTWAYNGKYHSDMTQAVLKDQGFVEKAAQLAVVGNLLVDIFASLGIWAAVTKGPWPWEAESLHFDNLFTPQDVKDYWKLLEDTAKKAFPNEAKECDCVLLLLQMGVILHAVQDFYSHSNWVEEWDKKGYHVDRIPTWDDALEIRKGADQEARDAQDIMDNKVYTGAWEAERIPLNLKTESHEELNKDAPNSKRGQQLSQSTPGLNYHEVSKGVAKRATKQWKEKIGGWLGEGCWRKLKNCKCDDGKFAENVRKELEELQKMFEAAGKWEEDATAKKTAVVEAYYGWENRYPKEMNKILRENLKDIQDKTKNPMYKYKAEAKQVLLTVKAAQEDEEMLRELTGVPITLTAAGTTTTTATPFTRTLPRGTTIRVLAPAEWAELKFSHWLLHDGRTFTSNPLGVTLVSPTVTLTAIYKRVAENKPPVAVLSCPRSAEVNKPFTCDGSRSYDPDGRVTQWWWRAVCPDIGHSFIQGGPTHTVTCGKAGTATIELYVVDDKGAKSAIVRATVSIR